jgi:asparagine synthase (glutamine-hydrolysing)
MRGSIEKFILREAARPVLTEAVYQRRKHAFWAPPVLRRGGQEKSEQLQDILRSAVFGAIPLFDRNRVIELLDRLHAADDAERQRWSPAVTLMIGACVLQERFQM